MSEELENEKSLTNSDLNKSFWLWCCMAQATYSFERLQAPGFVAAMIPAIERLYPDDEEARKAALKRHMEFFNTEPWLTGPGVVGITLSMEEERANGLPIEDEDINGVKTGLMGPMAGIGDTLRQGTLIPIIGSIAITLGLAGNFIAPIFYMVLTLALNHGVSYVFFKKAYQKGKEGISEIFQSGQLEKFMTFATLVGATTIGGLAATTVKAQTSAVLLLGDNKLVIQKLLDNILVNLIPLLIIFFTVWLFRKKMSASKILVVLIALGVLGVLFGIF